MVLLVVDTQNLITNSDLYNFNVFENAVKVLLAAARENNLEVISIRLLKKKNIIFRIVHKRQNWCHPYNSWYL